MAHFCTCGDTKCPFNPNNPTNLEKAATNPGARGTCCDACIRKNLALGEVPSCIFKGLGSIEGWDDFSVEGFARFVALHPRPDDVREAAAEKAARFEASYQLCLGEGINGALIYKVCNLSFLGSKSCLCDALQAFVLVIRPIARIVC